MFAQDFVQAEEVVQKKWIWKNIEITISDPSDAERSDVITTSLEDYQRISKGGKVMTTEETKKTFGAPLYRPVAAHLPLLSSNGLITQYFTLKDGKLGEPVQKLAHWDIFRKEREWAAVTQDIDTYTMDILNRKERVHETYPAYMKVMQIPGSDNVATLTPFQNSDVKRLAVHILDPKGKVIRLQIIGNLSEKDLIRLASAFKPSSE
ncbi:hypothetical protein [Brevibacillus invocatus]|nr:hypothetical protein [Brevibacillus invocatus]MCM3080729.1 hypothetical protein [Brevibacillus invocatus]MCM3430850.1 hypothetical protein [Brevibacillus invocatus]